MVPVRVVPQLSTPWIVLILSVCLATTPTHGFVINNRYYTPQKRPFRAQHWKAGIIQDADVLASSDPVTKLEAAFSSKDDKRILRKALHYSSSQSSNSNEQQHALGVATILAELKLDLTSVVAGLLKYNLPKDNNWKELEAALGEEIAGLVQGVAEIDTNLRSYHQVDRRPQQEKETENFRKLILALAQDIRVVLIKLADQTQKMRMMDDTTNREEQKRVTPSLVFGTFCTKISIIKSNMR